MFSQKKHVRSPLKKNIFPTNKIQENDSKSNALFFRNLNQN